jgi:multicomponent K+:H+ antiporter subunit A
VNLPKYPPHEPPRYMKLPVEILAGICLLVGLLPGLTVAAPLAAAAGAALAGPLPAYSLALWHGPNLPFMMSVIALAGGVWLYVKRRRFFAWNARLPKPDARKIFESATQASVRLALRFTHFLENASLQTYLVWLLAAAGRRGIPPGKTAVAMGGSRSPAWTKQRLWARSSLRPPRSPL